MDIHGLIDQLSAEEVRYIWKHFEEDNNNKKQEYKIYCIKEKLHKYINKITEENNKLTAIEQINDTFITSIEVILKCLSKPKHIKGFDLDKEQIKILLKHIENKRNKMEAERVWGEEFCIAVMVRLGRVFNKSKARIEGSQCAPNEIAENFHHVNRQIWVVLNKYIICCFGCMCEKDSREHKRLKKVRTNITKGWIPEVSKLIVVGGLQFLSKNWLAWFMFRGMILPIGGALAIGVPLYMGMVANNSWKDGDKRIWKNARKQLAIGITLYQHTYKKIHSTDNYGRE